jgi:hypothetical protein
MTYSYQGERKNGTDNKRQAFGFKIKDPAAAQDHDGI